MKGTITITHTRADGTLLEGSAKGDGVFELVRPYGFAPFRSLGCLGIRRSRDRAAQMWRINGARADLTAAGWTVEVTVDEDTRRSFAEAEAGERADRFAAYAGVKRIADGIPMGQPILVGHHSERRARRDAERKAVDEGERAKHWADRAEASANYARHRTDVPRTLRRIAKLEADRRRVGRSLERCTPGSDYAAELHRQLAELDEQLACWRAHVAKAEAEGFKVWSRDDFAKGDFVRYHGAWYEVLRVNAKSLTIPHIHNGIGREVVRRGVGRLDCTWTAPYDGVAGRKTAEEMARHLAGSDGGGDSA